MPRHSCTSHLRSFLLSMVGLAGPWSAAFADPTIQDIAPANAAFVIGVTNVKQLHETFMDGPYGSLMDEPEMRTFTGSIADAFVGTLEDMFHESDLDMEPGDLAWPQGAAGFSLSFHPEYFGTPLMLVMADFGSDKDKIETAIESLIEKRVGDDVEYDDSDYHGVTVHHLTEPAPEPDAQLLEYLDSIDEEYIAPQPFEEFYAWSGTTLLYATDEQQMLAALDAIEKGSNDSLGATRRFKNAMAQHPNNSPVFAYVNLGEVFDEYLPDPDEASFFPSPAGMLGSLGLRSLSSASMSAQFDVRDSLMATTIFLESSDPEGLFALAGKEEHAFEPPEFVGADAMSVMSYSVDLPGLSDVFENMLGTVMTAMLPDENQANMQIQQIMGIARPAFESLGNEIVLAGYPMPEALDGATSANIVAIPVTDEAVLTNIFGLGTGTGMLVARDFEGALVYELAPQAQLPAQDIACGIGHGFVFFGATTQIENSLRRLARPGAPKLADEPGFRSAIASLSPRAAGYSYTDSNAQMRSALQIMQSTLQSMDDPMFGELDPATQRWLDVMDNLPDAKVFEKHMGATVSELRRTNDGFIVKSTALGADR